MNFLPEEAASLLKMIYIRGTELHGYEPTVGASIADVRSFIAQQEEVDASELRLYSAGCPLDNDALPLSALTTDTIDCNVALLGGKVHGSLSRAGKVKGQTPKVDKQEKKKKKTGRAKRRIQYNRRFVNVVQGFGKKRGPNSNS